ncbi:MAG: hypothetical protein SGI83_15910 [Bacteroidota bacterium]|nr:hypothetical protein [Bacteroidota bacterium]
MNDVSSIEYKNDKKEVYGLVVEDNKEEMTLLVVSFTSINQFYDEFIKDFVADAKKQGQFLFVSYRSPHLSFY